MKKSILAIALMSAILMATPESGVKGKVLLEKGGGLAEGGINKMLIAPEGGLTSPMSLNDGGILKPDGGITKALHA